MNLKIQQMKINHYSEVMKLWSNEEGLSIKLADTRENIQRYLERNPGLSFIASINGKIIGAILCGHDGRRGYLHHMVISEEYRMKGIGRKLFQKCVDALKEIGIYKCHLFVKKSNIQALEFWKRLNLEERDDITMFSIISVDNFDV